MAAKFLQFKELLLVQIFSYQRGMFQPQVLQPEFVVLVGPLFYGS